MLFFCENKTTNFVVKNENFSNTFRQFFIRPTLYVSRSAYLSLGHSVTPSHCHYFTLSLSLCHSVPLSLCHSVILSLFDPVILSHCHSFTLSNCHSLSLSLSLIRPFFNSAILPVCKFTSPSV